MRRRSLPAVRLEYTKVVFKGSGSIYKTAGVRELTQHSDAQVFPASWLWFFPPVYFLHLVDERFWEPGTANWAAAHTGVYFTNTAWLAVNVPSFILLSLAATLTATRRWPDWVAVALATHLALHALLRIVGTAVTATLSPGVVTGVAVCLPLAVPVLIRGFRRLSKAQLRKGVVFGALSFQPFWHFTLLPLIPGRPPAA